MPGLALVISPAGKEKNQEQLERMLACLRHEADYVTRTGCQDRPGVCAGLTVLPGSAADCGPFMNEAGTVCLLFSGECFGGEDEAAGLKSRGHQVGAGRHDWLVHLYEELGPAFVEKLNGWFSGLVLDLRANTALLFNDRYGLGRIYHHATADGFYFASEAKALLKIFPGLRQLDARSLAEQFSCGCVLQNRTLFSGVSLLPPGSAWTFSADGNVRRETYFRPETWENQAPLDHESFYAALKEVFPRVLRRYLTGPLGMSLTGGLDGRLIMAWADPKPGSMPCYSFGGIYRDCADVTLARKVAAVCGQTHRVIPVDETFLDGFRSLAEKSVYLSDGTMDVSGAVELYANRLARQIAPVRLTGNYGSEILRGNVAFRPRAGHREFLTSDFCRWEDTAGETYRAEARGNRTTFIAFKQVPWHHYSRLSVEQSQLTLRSPYLDNELVGLVYRTPADLLTSAQPALRLIADGNPALARIPTDRGLTYRTTPVLTRMNHAWQEATVRAEYAYDYGMPQWFAPIDRAFRWAQPERLFLGRHKFYHFRVWYRDQLAPCVKDVLLDNRSLSRPYVVRERVEQMVREHTSGRRNHTTAIHQLLTAELTQRVLIENQ
jgi:asparagine synthase (glutamine-hydrolysing)